MGKDKKSKKEHKYTESREEKMLRRLEKKKRKREAEVERKTICGYTDENNRFGDSNLTQQFKWHKKEEMARAERGPAAVVSLDDLPERERRRAEAERKAKIEDEVEKVKRRREERERELAWMEEEKARMLRESEQMQHDEWERKADDFHLEQARLRSKIRVREGRAKPIDIMAKNLYLDDKDVEMTEPYKLFKGLTLAAIEELQRDIEMHRKLDKPNAEFWDAMVVVCSDEMEELKREEANRGKPSSAFEGGVHSAVQEEVVKMFAGKSFHELHAQEEEIQATLASDNPGDSEFWEAVLRRLAVAKAKAKLRQIHQGILRRRLDMLETRLAQEALAAAPAPQAPPEKSWDDAESEDSDSESDSEEDEAAKGSFSPVLIQGYQGEDVVDAATDKKAIEEQRKTILEAEADKLKSVAQSAGGSLALDEQLFSMEAGKGMGEDEVAFNTEVALEQQVYSWHDKYRPRKPRFFNRVHTGYEWNKYNQTHYDHDNPPPKIVQGYKFNIFYPDLIDKSKPPTFRLEEDGSPDTKIVRFIAGPPYEDIAFRVVNKEWEFSHKKGFKCTFDRGILHLYFNFVRHRYRR